MTEIEELKQRNENQAKAFQDIRLALRLPNDPLCSTTDLINGATAIRLKLSDLRKALEMAESWGEAGIETMDAETLEEYE